MNDTGLVMVDDTEHVESSWSLTRASRSVFLTFLLVIGPALPAEAADAWTLRANGYGPLRFGMTVRQVSRILGDPGKVPADETNCPYYQPRGRPELDLAFTEDGRLAYVGDRAHGPGVRTVNGIALGAPAEILEQKFAGRVLQDFRNYDLPSVPGADSYVADVYEGPYKWRFYVQEGKVSHISSGYVFAEDLCAD